MSTPVRHDARRTRASTIYIVGLALVGAALIGAGLRLGWGFPSFAGGAFFLLVAAIGAGQLLRGGAWEAACPSCGATLRSADHPGALDDAKLLRCDRCRTYVCGTTSLEVVAADYVHSEPIFAAPLPRAGAPLRFPPGCARCGGLASETVRVEASRVSALSALIPGVTILGDSFALEVPACDAHPRPVELIDDVEDGPSVLFASFPIYARFMALRDETPETAAAAAQARAAATDFDLERLPDGPRRKRAEHYGGRCPVHDEPLHVGPGYESTLELLPSHEAEAMEMALPFCLHVGETFTAKQRTAPTTLVWCEACVAAAREFE
ncbi:MAG: hypothetical protein R3A79_20830 [Nannocystaceae bacterium]